MSRPAVIGEDVSRETSQTLGTGGLNGNYSWKWLKDSGIMQRNFMQGRTIYKTGISMRKDGMAAEKGNCGTIEARRRKGGRESGHRSERR